MSIRALIPSLAAVVLLTAMSSARAEPYIAARTGLKCMQCHVNPTGGGMRTLFGETYAQTQLAAKKIGADEDLWTGQIDKFFSVGGNLRADYAYDDVPHQSQTNDFSVEEARAYLDFSVIPNRLSVYLDERVAPGNSTNLESNVRFWVKEGSMYVKAGRMYLPFGYRLEDDTAFVRELSGINMQTPDEGLEVGFEHNAWTSQIAISNGAGGASEIDHGKQISTRTEYVQSRWRAGASVLFNDTDLGNRKAAGIFGGYDLGPVTLLGELDYVDDGSIGSGRKSKASIAEADWLIRQGHNLKVSYEWLDPDDDIDENEQTRSSLVYEWAPIQFLQLRAGIRVYDGIPQSDLQNRRQAFVQLHGFF